MKYTFVSQKTGFVFLTVAMFVLFTAAVYADPPSVVEPGWEIRYSYDIGQNAYAFVPGVDIDGDGHREFVAVGRNPQQEDIFIFEATGDNSYELVWSGMRLGDAVLERGPIAVADTDNDGRMEVIVGDSGESNDYDLVLIYEFDPTLNGGQLGPDNPPFDPTVVLEVGFLGDGTADSRVNAVQVGDLDNDGNKEVIIGTVEELDRSLIIYESTGDNTFAEPAMALVETGICSLSPVADIDGDGEMEIVVFTE
ncbi:MAG: VCBS repeat-containing protein, partial [bacterium]